MADEKSTDAAARRIAEKYRDLVETTKVFTSGCTVCGSSDHAAAKHG